MTLTYTAVDKIPAIVARLRAGFNNNRLKTVAQRRDALQRLLTMIDEFEPAFVAAAQADLGKPAFETSVMEVSHMRTEAWGAYENVAKWMKPRSVHKEGIQRLDGAWIQPDPLGVVCVIGAWNYPFQLTIVGVIGAIAAGNTVLIKPSEVSPHCAEVIERAFTKYFDSDIVGFVQGAAEETTVMLKERFDHILYTGNAVVARIVMAAAAKHLTPVTLELGGKSPVYVHSDADLNVAARRIVWGRTVNAGQTCIAPDYILAHESIKAGLITALKKAITDFYGTDPKTSPDYARIVNDRHFARVSNLIKSAQVVHGGETDAATRYIAPTIMDDVSPDCAAMQEEIFGPLFPVLPIANPEAAIEFINKREKPLALYVFTRNGAVKAAFRENTSSGAILINDTLMHAAFESLPFGGVGNSGMGAYHGQLTFERFSHQKAVLEKAAGMEAVNAIRYAPYSEGKQAILGALAGRVGPSWRWFFDLTATVLSVGASFLGFGRFAQAKKNKVE